MKTGKIADPASDWTTRLDAFYKLDIGAYHAALGHPKTLTLVGFQSTINDINFVLSDTCENEFSYWHLPGVRVVYKVNGQVRSFGIDSLIANNGIWYVVHLGPNPRAKNIGTVDGEALGPGTPGPAGGC